MTVGRIALGRLQGMVCHLFSDWARVHRCSESLA